MAIDRTGIASDAFAITPHDTNANRAEAIFTGSGGTIVLVTEDGNQVTFTGTAAGSVLPVSTLRVLATGTTATGIVGFR